MRSVPIPQGTGTERPGEGMSWLIWAKGAVEQEPSTAPGGFSH